MKTEGNAPARAMESFLQEHADIEHFDAIFVDACGAMRGKRVPRVDVDKVVNGKLNIPQALFALCVTGEGVGAGGRGWGDGDPDGYGYPLMNTLCKLPWGSSHIAQVLMGMREGAGRPVDIDPRQLLTGLVERLSTLGLTAVAAVELEFYLLDPKRGTNGQPVPATGRDMPGGRNGQNYGMEVLNAHQPVLDTIDRFARAMGVPTRAVSAESGRSQFEINLSHVNDPVLAADHAILLKQIVRKAAHEHGMEASFMAKPFSDQPGSGMHVHLSLVDQDGNNAFAADPERRTLRQVVAGLLQLLPACLSFFAPNLNSFRRFTPGSFVPVNLSWGDDNRSVAIRVPSGDPCNLRIEHRVAGADANPLLVMAAILAGTLQGLDAELEAPEPSIGDMSEVADARWPKGLLAALELTASDERLRQHLGHTYPAFYADLKRREFDALLSNYSATEYEWYL